MYVVLADQEQNISIVAALVGTHMAGLPVPSRASGSQLAKETRATYYVRDPIDGTQIKRSWLAPATLML